MLPLTWNIELDGTTGDRTRIENDIQCWESDAFTARPFIQIRIFQDSVYHYDVNWMLTSSLQYLEIFIIIEEKMLYIHFIITTLILM